MPNPSISNALPTPRAVYITLAISFFLQAVVVRAFIVDTAPLFSIISGQLLGIAVPLFVIAALRRYDLRPLFAWQRPSLVTIGCVCGSTLLIAIGVDHLVGWIDRVVSIDPMYNEGLRRLAAIHSLGEAIEKFTILCLIPATLEESLFRGFAQTSLRKAYGPRLALIMTSLLFAAGHPILWHFPLYFALGLYLGWLYQWKETLWFPVIAHLVNNTWTLFTSNL